MLVKFSLFICIVIFCVDFEPAVIHALLICLVYLLLLPFYLKMHLSPIFLLEMIIPNIVLHERITAFLQSLNDLWLPLCWRFGSLYPSEEAVYEVTLKNNTFVPLKIGWTTYCKPLRSQSSGNNLWFLEKPKIYAKWVVWEYGKFS